MEKVILNNKEVLLAVGAVAAVAGVATIGAEAASYIKQGLSDSQKIRVAEASVCPSVESASEARFVGCNSIL